MKGKWQKLLLCTLALVLVLMLLTSCSNSENNISETKGKVIVDQLGRTVELPEKIEKVAAPIFTAGRCCLLWGKRKKLLISFRSVLIQKL